MSLKYKQTYVNLTVPDGYECDSCSLAAEGSPAAILRYVSRGGDEEESTYCEDCYFRIVSTFNKNSPRESMTIDFTEDE